MKVTFDATIEDFVDVAKRSAPTILSQNLILALAVVGASCVIGGLVFLVARDWLAPSIATVTALAFGAITMFNGHDRYIRTYLKERLNITGSVPTVVEIDEAGVKCSCLGQTTIQDWNLIEQIEETADAIYFRNITGVYCAARKRGFGSEGEIKEFLTLARQYSSEADVPVPAAVEA